MSDNYQRLFYILKNMDSDVGYPTGYIKVEINCEAAKLQISLNNLLNRQGLIYQLYGIKKNDKQLIYTVICDIPNENGRADVKMSTDIHRMGSNELRLEDINIFAIITQQPIPNRVPAIKCPLVAYTKGEVSWRREFEALILNKGPLLTSNDNIAKIATMNYTKSEVERKGASENKVETYAVDDFNKEQETERLPNILTEIGLFQDMNEETKILADARDEDRQLAKDNERSIIDVVKNEEKDTTVKVNNGEKDVTKILEDIENYEADVSDEIEDDQTKVSKDIQIDNAEIFEHQNRLEQAFDIMGEELPIQNIAKQYSDRKFNISDKFESAVTNIYSKHKSAMPGQENTPEAVLADNDILSSVQKNFNDISSIDIAADKISNELNMPSLKEELDKSFEGYNPFKMRSKNFKWWKINSPGYLNNILFRYNIKTYLLFNPKVMLAHYKYRYIIFGIRNDRHSGKEYFVCGVPGVYSIDENPFGNMGSWAQIEGYKPKYGAFGYWIVLIEPRTGKLLNVK
ncbi:MAG: hypothetical protein ACYDG2_06675 [Ruminiclostridium sp.]